MKKTLATAFFGYIITVSTPTFADSDDAAIQISKPNDGQMTCEQITSEISSMDAVIEESKSSQSSSSIAGIGTSIAGHFAGWAGGGIGAAVATTGANAVIGKNKQTAEERMKAAEQRRTMLMGIYAGKGC